MDVVSVIVVFCIPVIADLKFTEFAIGRLTKKVSQQGPLPCQSHQRVLTSLDEGSGKVFFRILEIAFST